MLVKYNGPAVHIKNMGCIGIWVIYPVDIEGIPIPIKGEKGEKDGFQYAFESVKSFQDAFDFAEKFKKEYMERRRNNPVLQKQVRLPYTE